MIHCFTHIMEDLGKFQTSNNIIARIISYSWKERRPKMKGPDSKIL